jgi:predicted dienelactone hydrolase
MSRVGFTKGKIEDGNRSNWAANAPRPIAWSAWYPTDEDARKDFQPTTQPGSSFLAGKVIDNAPLAKRREPYPVVLLSHGTGGTAAGLDWLGHRLAKKGFVAIGVDHHGNTAAEPYCPEGFLCWWERARDLTVLMDHIVVEEPFSGRLDLDRIFAAGFSLGGYTVLSLLGAITDMTLFFGWARDYPWGSGPREFPDLATRITPLLETSAVFRASWERQSLSYKDARIKAALLCAPAPTVRGLTAESLRGIHLPIAITVGGADREAPSKLCSEWLLEYLPKWTFDPLGPTVGHYVFLCECSETGRKHEAAICIDAPDVDRRSIHYRAAALAVNTFSSS